MYLKPLWRLNPDIMLTLKLLREDPEYVIERLSIRNIDGTSLVGQILEADTNRRAAQTQADALIAEQKKMASEIGPLMQQGKKDEAEKSKQPRRRSRKK